MPHFNVPGTRYQLSCVIRRRAFVPYVSFLREGYIGQRLRWMLPGSTWRFSSGDFAYLFVMFLPDELSAVIFLIIIQVPYTFYVKDTEVIESLEQTVTELGERRGHQ